MKAARIVVLGVAIAAGGAAALMIRSDPTPQPAPMAAAAPAIAAMEVLVAAADLPMGQSLKAADLRWQAWPSEGSSTGLIKKSDVPNAVEELTGSIARAGLLSGEPIRREKLIKGNGGFMSAILPSGMRAVAISIDNRGATSAGGFILPNDRVDVIRTSQSTADAAGAPISEIILANIRVLAIGQNVQERNGERVVTGETATLELSPAQAEMVVLSQRIGQISLALRSIADVNETGTPMRDDMPKPLQIIRYGVQQQGPSQ